MKRSAYFLFGAAVAISFVLGFGLGIHIAAPGETSIPPEQFTQYSLFTWNSHSDDFCFALMLEYKRGNFLKSWTSKWGAKCGTVQLKDALNALPQGTHVYWNTWPPKNCNYPEKRIVNEVIDFAQTKGVHLELLPALP